MTRAQSAREDSGLRDRQGINSTLFRGTLMSWETDLLDIPDVVLTANSVATLQSASAGTQRQIRDALGRLHTIELPDESDFHTVLLPEKGRYISRVGDSRIVWTRTPEDDRILVLTIFIPVDR
jgi:hypothetical protein